MKSFKQFIIESADKMLFKKDIKAGAKLLAASTPKDFNNDYETSGTANIIGHSADHPKHIAALGQVARNPKYETLHTIYMRGDRVAGHTAISNRLPSVVRPFGSGSDENLITHLDSMRQHMKNIDADGYYLMHNHPNGNPAPSDADHDITDTIAYGSSQQNIKGVSGFRGHVIVNHKKFAVIHPIEKEMNPNFFKDNDVKRTYDKNQKLAGNYTIHDINQEKSYDLTNASHPHEVLGTTINHPTKIAEAAKTFQNNNHATVFGATADLKVNAAAHIPLHLLTGKTDKEKLEASARLRKFIKMTGSANNTIISVPTKQHAEDMHHLIHSGLATDIVTHDGVSSRFSGASSPKNQDTALYLGGKVKTYRKDET